MPSISGDIELFGATLQELHIDFQTHPFHYGNENPVTPELYRRLRGKLTPETVPLEYRQDHSNMSEWRNRDMFQRVTRAGQRIPRVRPEVRFYADGVWGGPKTDFDLAIFSPSSPATMQGKKEGVGNFVDIEESELSVLCEVKHSMNMSGQLRSGGKTDVAALAEYPGTVGRRYFVFIDWWPRDGYGNITIEKDIRQLEERLGSVDRRVDVAYLPREGELQVVREIGH